MAVAKEFIHEFRGFGGYESRCHIRILDEPDKPLVVICSQLANKPGTSVTNAAEFIAQSVQEYLERGNPSLKDAIRAYIKESKFTKILGDLVGRLKESNGMTVFALESLKLALERRESFSLRKRKISQMVWVEHYDASIGLSPKCEYLEVEFDPDTWVPRWKCRTPEYLSHFSGYPTADFKVPHAVIHQA